MYMWTCVYICMIYMFLCVFVYNNMHVCMYLDGYMCMNICTYVYVCVHLWLCIWMW